MWKKPFVTDNNSKKNRKQCKKINQNKEMYGFQYDNSLKNVRIKTDSSLALSYYILELHLKLIQLGTHSGMSEAQSMSPLFIFLIRLIKVSSITFYCGLGFLKRTN